jgi:Tol biopolymer transport system component
VDLFVSRTSGGGRVRLTDDTAREEDPAFSPDGDRLAFTRWNPSSGEPEILVVPTLGGEARPILESAQAPAWSPDGSRIACILRRSDGRSALITIASDGSGQREILTASADRPFLRAVDWSPDGASLVVERSQGGMAGELWLVPSGGGPARCAVQDPPGVVSHSPAFARNGRSIVYSSNRGGALNLWSLPIDPPGEPTRLTSGPGPDIQPTVSADGKIAFVNARSRTALLVLRLGTGEVREAFRASVPIWAPSFSPDGREIAFNRGEPNGEWHIWIVPAEGGAARQLTSGALREMYPRFTPDGASVLFNHWSPGPDRIWLVSRAGGPPVAVTPARDGDDSWADVSPDGRRIVFTRTEGNTDRIYLAELENAGAARPLADAPSTVAKWSPDGTLIAYAPDRGLEGALCVVRPDGSGARVVASPGGWPFWLADGKRLGYLAVGKDANAEIRVVRIDRGGPPERIEGVRFRGTNYPCSVSRDGRFLATANTVDTTSDIWLLEP